MIKTYRNSMYTKVVLKEKAYNKYKRLKLHDKNTIINKLKNKLNVNIKNDIQIVQNIGDV